MLTNLPRGAGRSPSLSREGRTGREDRLRLRERRWLTEEEAEVESSALEAPTGALFVVDLNAAVAIARSGCGKGASSSAFRLGFGAFNSNQIQRELFDFDSFIAP